jgi:hypothetical protein
MRNVVRRLTFVLVLFVLASCEKEDVPVVLPPPGNLVRLTAVLGNNYDQQVYVSLVQGRVESAPLAAYDLALESQGDARCIYLNTGKLMFAACAGTFDFQSADTSGLQWKTDVPALEGDSTAFGRWWSNNSGQQNITGSDVFFVDRGALNHTGSDRYRKFQVVSHSDTAYVVRFSRIESGAVVHELTIPKNPSSALVYLSFNASGQIVNQAPSLNNWDFVLTRYTHIYYSEPVTSPYRHYPVVGGQMNIWNGTAGSMIEKDSTPFYLPFADFTISDTASIGFTRKADVIGYDWKYYDFSVGRFFMAPFCYYIIRASDGLYYKMRMLDFYDENGTKGTVTFEYQRI